MNAPAPTPPPGLLRDPLRVLLGAGVAASAALHGRMVLGGAHGTGWSVVMAAMALLCLSCLVALLRGRDPSGAVRMAMGMALAMALAHVLVLPLVGGGGARPHHGGGPAGEAARTGHGALMLLAVAVELAVAATAVAWVRRRGRRAGPQPGLGWVPAV